MNRPASSLLALPGLLLVLSLSLTAQSTQVRLASLGVPADNTNESFFANLHDDLVQEKVNLGSCGSGLKGIPGCAETLVTGTPFHIAVGSLAPQNGIAAGLAFEEMYHPTYCASWVDFTHAAPAGTRNPCHWSLTMSADGKASKNGSWSAGVYVTATRISSRVPVPHFPGQAQTRRRPATFTHPSPTVSFYSESTSLNRVYFYGLGPNTTPLSRADFGFSENVTGVSATIPLVQSWFAPLGITLLGEVNGRRAALRDSYGDTSPSIGVLYNEGSAPGVTRQPAYVQTGEGVRLIPELPEAAHLKLNYLVELQQFTAPSSQYSFRRFTTDLDHQLVLYTRNVGRPPSPRPPLSGQPMRTIPPISSTRDVTGSLSARLFIQESIANAGRTVPFYFDPTIGGSDIDGQSILPSYPDYRFRAPNALLIHGAYEQSLGKVPIGLFLGIDEAKVGLRRDDIAFNHLRHSYSAGLTVHAGGVPVIYLLFSWGGNEGRHTTATISDVLLGTGSRPSLF